MRPGPRRVRPQGRASGRQDGGPAPDAGGDGARAAPAGPARREASIAGPCSTPLQTDASELGMARTGYDELRKVDLEWPTGAKFLDSVRLVSLDANHDAIYPEAAHHDANAEIHPFRVFHHATVVGRQVGLTLAAFDHQRVDLTVIGWRELDVRREGGAAQADETATRNLVDYLIG